MRAKITTKNLIIVFLVVTMSFDNAHTAPGKFIITGIYVTKRVICVYKLLEVLEQVADSLKCFH